VSIEEGTITASYAQQRTANESPSLAVVSLCTFILVEATKVIVTAGFYTNQPSTNKE
jgi:hypothetical protein